MKYFICLLLTSCCHTYTRQEVIEINNKMIDEQIYLCGDLICEASDDLTYEQVMAELKRTLEWEWILFAEEHFNE